MNKNIKNMLDKYMLNCAKNVLQDAKNKAPVDTGALKESLDMEKTGEFSYIIGSDLEYSIYQELGTKKMSAQPYLRPALYNKNNYRS